MRKWLVLPKCLSSRGLYGNRALSLPIFSLLQVFQIKLEMNVKESQGSIIRGTVPTLATGKKWTPAVAVNEAKAALRHWDIVRHVQLSRGCFGWAAAKPTWQKATPTECWLPVLEL